MSLDIPAVPDASWDWRNDDQAAVDALLILKLSTVGPDAVRMAEYAAAAGDLICLRLDRRNPVPGAIPGTPPPALRQAHANVTVELWRRKDAPFGVVNSFSPDDVAIRIGNDPLRGVENLINPYRERWGLA